MAGKIRIEDLKRFDAADYLDTPEAVAEYLTIVLEENDTDALIEALGTIARVRGMADIAQAAGLGRESLYKALSSGAQPRFDTIQRVITALGLRIRIEPSEAA